MGWTCPSGADAYVGGLNLPSAAGESQEAAPDHYRLSGAVTSGEAGLRAYHILFPLPGARGYWDGCHDESDSPGSTKSD